MGSMKRVARYRGRSDEFHTCVCGQPCKLKATIEVNREWGAHRFGMTLAVAVVLVSIATVIGTFRNQQERWSTCRIPQLHHLAGRPSPHRLFPFGMMYLSNHVESKCERAHMQSFHLHSNIVLR